MYHRFDNDKDENSSCCLKACAGFGLWGGLTGLYSGVSAFNTWLGGVILNSAGWAPASVSTLPVVGAVGGATIAGGCLALLIPCGCITGFDDLTNNSNSAGGSAATSGAILSTTGAAMLGWSGEKLGFAAASGAIGGVVGTAALASSVVVIAACGVCFIACVKKGDDQTIIYAPLPEGALNASGAVQIEAVQNLDGALSAENMAYVLRARGLDEQADSLLAADKDVKDMVANAAAEQTENTLKAPRVMA